MPIVHRHKKSSSDIVSATASTEAPSSPASPSTPASPVGDHNMNIIFTTVMVRNIPTRFTSLSLIEVLKDYGFDKTFDFFYLPMDFKTKKNPANQ